MGTRRRLDAELVRRGLARSREQAAGLVTARRVLGDGQPGQVREPGHRFVHPGVTGGGPHTHSTRHTRRLR